MDAEKVATTVGKGTGYLFIGLASSYVLSFIFNIFVARTSGAEALGMISLLMTMLSFFSIAFFIGLNSSMVKFISELLAKGKDISVVYSTGMKTMFLSSFVGAIALFLLSDFLAVLVFGSSNLIIVFQLASAALFLRSVEFFFRGCSIGFQWMGNTAATTISERVSKLLFAVAFFYAGYGVFGPVFAAILSFLVTAFVSSVLFLRKIRPKIKGFDKTVARGLIGYGAPMMISSGANTVFNRIGSFLIGAFLTVELVGYYAAAVTLNMFLENIVLSLTTTLFPAFSSINAQKKVSLLKGLLNRSVKYAVYLMLPACAGLFMLAEPVIRLMYGADFFPAVLPLRILTIGSFLFATSAVCKSFIIGTSRPENYTKIVLVSGLINIVTGAVLIPLYGLVGGAMSTTISLFALFTLCFRFILKRTELRLGYLHKPVISTCAMLAVLYIIKIYLIASTWSRVVAIVVLGALSYFMVLYAFGGFDSTDRRIIFSFISKIKKRLRL